MSFFKKNKLFKSLFWIKKSKDLNKMMNIYLATVVLRILPKIGGDLIKFNPTYVTLFTLCALFITLPFAGAVESQKTVVNSTDNIILKKGMTNQNIIEMQKWLEKQGLYEGNIDGYFGPYTENAVKKFQEKAGITVDGVVGVETLKAMEKWGFSYNSLKNTIKSSESFKASAGSKKSKSKYATKTYRGNKYKYNGRGGYINGMDCWAMSDYLAAKYRAMGYNPVIRHAVTSLSKDHRWVEVNGQPVSDYASLPWIYKPTG